MSTILNPPLEPGQTGLLGFNQPTAVVRGAGTLNGAVTENFGQGNTGACSLYDVAALNETLAVAGGEAPTPLATIDANASSAGLNLAFTHGLCVVPAASQACSVAVTPSPTAIIL